MRPGRVTGWWDLAAGPGAMSALRSAVGARAEGR